MHLRDGKVLGARSGDPRTMAEPKKVTERRHPDIKVESDDGSLHVHHSPAPHAGDHENVRAPLRGDPRDELILHMRRDLQALKDKVRQLEELKDIGGNLPCISQFQLPQYAPQQTLRHEDGETMSTFLANYEIECLEGLVPPELWATRMRRYLTGDALDYYLHMRRMGVDLTQWDPIRERFLQRFCRDTRDQVLARLARNTWRGDHGLYSTRFAQAVAKGVTIPADELVGYFLANLPLDIRRSLTQNGTKRYHDWEEAAAALSKLEEPWSIMEAECRRFQQSLQDARARENAPQHYRQSTAGGQQQPRVFRCRECQGVGHREINCPLRQPGYLPKRGFTCKRCGGKDHFARDCAPRTSGPTASATPPDNPLHPSDKQPTRSNGVA